MYFTIYVNYTIHIKIYSKMFHSCGCSLLFKCTQSVVMSCIYFVINLKSWGKKHRPIQLFTPSNDLSPSVLIS